MFVLQPPVRKERSATLASIPDGVQGIGDTLTQMTAWVKEFKADPEIREMALFLTKDLPQKDFVGEIRELFMFVRDHVRYTGDVTDTETLQSPVLTLHNRAGDCDDKALLLAALLESINHPTKFVAVGFERNTIDHVYVETKVGQRWMALDATEAVDMGWSPPGVKSKIERYN